MIVNKILLGIIIAFLLVPSSVNAFCIGSWCSPLPCENECWSFNLGNAVFESSENCDVPCTQAGQPLLCTPDGEGMYTCGDYDDWWYPDACLEVPPGLKSGRHESSLGIVDCNYGCIMNEPVKGGVLAPACLQSNVYENTTGCIEGNTRCTYLLDSAAVNLYKESPYIFDQYFATLAYTPKDIEDMKDFLATKIESVSAIAVCEDGNWKKTIKICPYECVGGTCSTFEQWQGSECTEGQSRCVGNERQPCVEYPVGSKIFRWSPDITNWYSTCEFGCKEVTGKAICTDRNGDVPTDVGECIFGEKRCWPIPDGDWVQSCTSKDFEDKTRWTPIDTMTEQACLGGCHLGQCLPFVSDPDVYECLANCTLGNTRCAEGGKSIAVCEPDPITGCNSYSLTSSCPSGKCMFGQCVPQGGLANYIILEDTGIIPGMVTDIAVDQNYLYITHVELPSGFGSGYANITWFNYNGSFYKSMNLSTFLTDLSTGNPDPNVYTKADDVHFFVAYDNGTDSTLVNGTIAKLDRQGNVVLKRQISNTDAGCTNMFNIFGLALDKENELLYVHVRCTGTSPAGSGGILEYSSINLSFTGKKLCVNMNPVFNYCSFEQSGFQPSIKTLDAIPFAYHNKKLHMIMPFDLGTPAGDVGIGPPNWIIFTTDGNFIGTDLREIEGSPTFYYEGGSVSSKGYSALDVFNNKMYMAIPYRSVALSATGNETRVKLAVKNMREFCSHECFEGAISCQGFFHNQIAKCVKSPAGCWVWSTSLPDYECQLNANNDCTITDCSPYTCEDFWVNEKVKSARCLTTDNCKDVCVENETSCDDTGKYVRTCAYRNILQPVGYVGLTLNQSCFTWGTKQDWNFCGLGGRCLSGKCVTQDVCNLGDTKCFNVDEEMLKNLEKSHGEDVASQFLGGFFILECKNIPNMGGNVWDRSNPSSFCYWGCDTTHINGSYSATCKNDTAKIASGIRSSIIYFQQASEQILSNNPSSSFMWVVFIMLVFMIATYKHTAREGGEGSWQITAFVGFVVFVAGMFVGAVSPLLLYIIIILMAIVAVRWLILSFIKDD